MKKKDQKERKIAICLTTNKERNKNAFKIKHIIHFNKCKTVNFLHKR